MSDEDRDWRDRDDDAEPVDPETLDRLFVVLERAVEGPARLDSAELDRLLDVLEAAVVDSTQLDPTELDQLLVVLEEMVSDEEPVGEPADVLSVLETAIVDPERIGETTEGVFSVLEAALTDPDVIETGVDDLFSMLDTLGLDVMGLSSRGLREGRSRGRGRSRDRDAPRESRDRRSRSGRSSDRRSVPRSRDGDGPSGRPGHSREDDGSPDAFRIARIVAAATQRTTQYSVQSGIRTGTRMVQAAASSNSLVDLLDETRDITFSELRRLGVDVGEEDDDDRDDGSGRRWWGEGPVTEEELRERGAELLERSSAIDYTEEVHPGYPYLLDQLAPDEARILRLLALQGPQPSVSVRSRGWVPFTSKLVAADLTMVGTEAGCRHEDRVPIYLDNLARLGLIRRSPEPVDDLKRYQVLDAQPAVEEAAAESTRPKLVRRSIHLTALGVDFCEACLDLDVLDDQASREYVVPEEELGPPKDSPSPLEPGGSLADSRRDSRSDHRDDDRS